MTREQAYQIMEIIHAAITAYDARVSSDGGLSDARRVLDLFNQLLATIEEKDND